jgi:hypothetical protein
MSLDVIGRTSFIAAEEAAVGHEIDATIFLRNI